jgi:SAM-dependent methyltransferase
MELLTDVQYRFLKTLSPGEPDVCSGEVFKGKSKLEMLLGRDLVCTAIGKTVIDFGCGEGHEAVELAKLGAKKVIGLDIREDILEVARRNAESAGVADRCEFGTATSQSADVVVSIDAFEHFQDPAYILTVMDSLLTPNGEVLVSFGPTWYHPLGGHLFSVFPWAHLAFTEKALIRWRADFKSDGATRFSEVAGGLNQITIRRFEQIVRASPFQFKMHECVPIRRLARLHNRWTREFTTAIVRCLLVKRSASS